MKKIITVLLCGTFFMPMLANAQYGRDSQSNEYMFGLFIGAIVSLFILYAIIAGATKADKRQKELIRQSNFLKAIAKQLGVGEDIIADIETIYKKS
jgi:hypothetical protein